MDVSLILRLAQMCCPFYNSTVFHAECLVFLSLVCMEYVNTHTHTHTHTSVHAFLFCVTHTLFLSLCLPSPKKGSKFEFYFSYSPPSKYTYDK